MDSNKLTNWLQVAGNFGLLAGLVLVAVQINQNSELGRLSFFFTETDTNISVGGMTAGDDLARAMAIAVDGPENLTTAEMIQLDQYLFTTIVQLNRRDYLYEAGVYQDPVETVYSGVIPWLFGNKFALAWWDERRMTLGSEHVREYIDLELQEMQKSSQALVFGNIKKVLAAE